MTKAVTPLAFAETFEAFQIMAAETARVYKEPSTAAERFVMTGSYVLTCAIATERYEPDVLPLVFAMGLQTAGMEAEQAVDLAERYDSDRAKRLIFSLAYLDAVEGFPGLERRKKSTTLNEPAFIRGIIARKRLATRSS